MLLPYLNKDLIEAGCDEAGRGCLAGAVYAAAVILPTDFKNELLNDSKQLTEKQRYALREVIEKEALAWAVGVVSPEEIDKINILNASFLAMHRAVDQLNVRPQHLLIDGNRFKKYRDLPHTTVVKGDGKYLSIAAASIISNNVNAIMKRMTSLSITLMIPTLIASFYGMNVDIHLESFPHAFIFIILLSAILSAVTFVWFRRIKWF
jgi:ribonuclease HII